MTELLVLILLLFVLVCWLAGPFIAIWAINTLFGTTIAYTAINWLAGFVLLLLLKGTTSSSLLLKGTTSSSSSKKG